MNGGMIGTCSHNYHLGNKFYSPEEGKCYAPCPPGQVPAYAKDPVDGASVDLSSKDALDKCVPRNEYFSGKYYEGSEFCPISWIHRLGTTVRENEEMLQVRYDATLEGSGGIKNNYMTDLERQRQEDGAGASDKSERRIGRRAYARRAHDGCLPDFGDSR